MTEFREIGDLQRKRRRLRAAVMAASLVIAAAVTVFACRPELFSKCLSPLAASVLDKPPVSTGVSAVTTASLPLRSGEEDSSPVIRTLEKGTSVRLLTDLSSKSDWVQVSTGNGETGWCVKKYLSVNGTSSVASSSSQSAASAASSAQSAVSASAASSASSASSKVSLVTATPQVTLEQAKKPLSISVSIADQRVTVYDAEKRIVEQFVCSTGSKGSETITGTFRIAERGKSFYSKRLGEGGYYWTQFHGDYLFHSVPFDENYEIEPEEATKLGTPASHGCVRLSVENAKWIYDHIPRGTVVTIQ
jgi:lipoprotein-anchoring transpeptidase ErfK/SrfK